MRPLLWIELVAWIVLGWVFSSWRTTVIGYIVTLPVLFLLLYWGEYRRMKAERRDLFLRRRVPENQIEILCHGPKNTSQKHSEM